MFWVSPLAFCWPALQLWGPAQVTSRAASNWRGILVIGCLGGIGLTVPIYIAAGAFATSPLLISAKFALLVSAMASAMIGLFVGKVLLPAEATGKI